jgi:hypothetical protein
VSATALVLVGVLSLAVCAATTLWTHHDGASATGTVLALGPAMVIMSFAIIYGVLSLADEPAVSMATGSAHLVDVYLLLFGVASTGGFLDLTLHGRAARVLALTEMLLMVSVAGGSLYVATRAAWVRLLDVVRRRGEQLA